MKPLAAEWIEKAEGDFATVLREMRARKRPNYDAACFHAQQCAEKYLKAILQEQDVLFGKTRNLLILLDTVVRVNPMLEMIRQDMQALNVFSSGFRYPGEDADKPMAAKAVNVCRRVRERLRSELGLSDSSM